MVIVLTICTSCIISQCMGASFRRWSSVRWSRSNTTMQNWGHMGHSDSRNAKFKLLNEADIAKLFQDHIKNLLKCLLRITFFLFFLNKIAFNFPLTLALRSYFVVVFLNLKTWEPKNGMNTSQIKQISSKLPSLLPYDTKKFDSTLKYEIRHG